MKLLTKFFLADGLIGLVLLFVIIYFAAMWWQLNKEHVKRDFRRWQATRAIHKLLRQEARKERKRYEKGRAG